MKIEMQTAAFLWAIALGGMLGLVYDVFRIIRIAVNTHKTVVFVQDILFFVFCTMATFVFLMGMSDGKTRFFLLTGEFLGAVIYFFTVGRIIIKSSGAVIALIKSFFSVAFKYIFYPLWRLFYRIVLLFFAPFAFLRKILKKNAKKLKFSLKTRGVILYNHFTGFAHRNSKNQR